MSNYYETLGVPHNATNSDIKKAYKKLALRWHPDKNQNNQEAAQKRFQDISEAYEILSDPQKRFHFDRYDANNYYVTQNEPRGFFDSPRFFREFELSDPFDTFNSFFESDFHSHLNVENWSSFWPHEFQSSSGIDHFQIPSSSDNVYMTSTSTTSHGNSFHTVVTTYKNGEVNTETYDGLLDSKQ